MTFRRFMSLLAMALLWTGSQIPVYLYGTFLSAWLCSGPSNSVSTGSIPPYIYQDIGGVDRWIWFVSCEIELYAW